ncbi:MAG: aminotransferase class I/II-fold pyridoxal phosphate-dependent enzyme [Gammaproteobacteria bacterium]|nr:aminotransferase class I/II-fold pyridoxal phosphate-dependent enzyme [Gammaproteobacteria bacterium]
MSLETDSLALLPDALATLAAGFADLPEHVAVADIEALRPVLQSVAERMQDNFPYQHPLYAGQMLKPPHPLARLAYMLALWINPNNHALDGGRASSAMEKEAVANIARMVGWGDEHLGHLSSAGTIANLEALWVAGKLHPGKKIVASSQAHYTHSRISEVLQLNFEAVPVDACARMDLAALETLLQSGEIGTVVATLGTTGVGSVDPLPQLLALQEHYEFRIHVDAAYGGYFKLASNLAPEAAAAFACIDQVDSIVVDPHKHGLQPYGCGCVLFRDPGVGRIYQHDSPYTYFSSDQLHLGEISLECSRAGASAVALWATQQLLPLEPGGEFARDLEKSRQAALTLYQRLQQDPEELALLAPELDIVLWGPRADTGAEISRLSQQCFDAASEQHLHLALIKLPASLLAAHWPAVTFDSDTVTCLRSCLMKPEHLDWLDRIWEIYKSVRA